MALYGDRRPAERSAGAEPGLAFVPPLIVNSELIGGRDGLLSRGSAMIGARAERLPASLAPPLAVNRAAAGEENSRWTANASLHPLGGHAMKARLNSHALASTRRSSREHARPGDRRGAGLLIDALGTQATRANCVDIPQL